VKAVTRIGAAPSGVDLVGSAIVNNATAPGALPAA